MILIKLDKNHCFFNQGIAGNFRLYPDNPCLNQVFNLENFCEICKSLRV